MRERDLQDFSEFLAEFQSETDRGAALVGAALLDQRLLDTLKAFLVDDKISAGLLEGANAPLGTLDARTRAAYAMGLIDGHEFEETNLIRKIRNEFAHRVHGTTFEDPRIKELCRKIKSDRPGGRTAFFEDNPRGIFINAIVLTVLGLTYRAERVSLERRISRTWEH